MCHTCKSYERSGDGMGEGLCIIHGVLQEVEEW